MTGFDVVVPINLKNPTDYDSLVNIRRRHGGEVFQPTAGAVQ